jgi:tetratricopeptide (TPR) repeat protein
MIPASRKNLALGALLVPLTGTALYLWTLPARRAAELAREPRERLLARSRSEPDNARVFFELGKRERDRGDLAAAYDAFTRAADRAPHDADIWIAAAQASETLNGAQGAFDLLFLFVKNNPDDLTARLALAQLYQRNRSHDRAYDEARKVVERDPKNALAWAIVGREALYKDLLVEAEQAIRTAVALAPGAWENQQGLGDLLAFKEEYAAALPYYREATRLAPQEPMPWLLLGNALFHTDTTVAGRAAAKEALQKSLAITDRIALTHQTLGEIAEAENRWQEALAHLETSRQLAPGNPAVYFELARVYRQLGQSARAKDSLDTHRRITLFNDRKKVILMQLKEPKTTLDQQQALRLELARGLAAHYDDAGALENYQRLLAQAPTPTLESEARAVQRRLAAVAPPPAPAPGDPLAEGERLLGSDPKQAIAAFLDIVKKDRKNAAAFQGVGLGLLATGETAGAANYLGEALRLDPKLIRARFALAEISRQNGLIQEARIHFEKGLALKPDDAEAWYRLGLTLATFEKKTQEALTALDKAHRLQPERVDIALDLAETRAEQGQADDAEALFRQALTKAPESADVQARFGGFLAEKRPAPDAQNEAERLLRAALITNPEDDFARFRLGQIALGRGDAAGAVVQLEPIVARNPKAKEILYTLSRAYRRLGQNEKAQQMLKRVNALQSAFDALQAAQEAVSVAPRDPAAHLRLARLYVREDNLPPALYHYRVCLTLAPTNADAAREKAVVSAKLGPTPTVELLQSLREAGAR